MTTTNSLKKGQSNLTQTDNGLVCASCAKHKYQLRPRKSKLSGQKMLVCNDCFEKKYEPRWLVIVTAQDEGIETVQDYLVHRRYYGDEIPAVDLLK